LYDHSTNGTYINHEVIGKGAKKLLQNGATVDFLFRGKGKEPNISFIFQDCKKEEEEQHEAGGPHQFYHIMHFLGSGTFAEVRLAIEKTTGERYALKIIDKKKFLFSTSATKRQISIMDEVKILSQLDHPNIIGIKRAFETESYLYLVLELVSGGELLDKIATEKKFSEDKARYYFRQILEATKYLHEQGIAHRDLKPENILLTDDDLIKLSDFGLSRVVDQTSFMKTICGTPQYVAPEIHNSSRSAVGYGLACDLWSSGVILYFMLVGYHPFSDTRPSPVYEQIQNGDYEFSLEDWTLISPSAKYLIKRLLTTDPRKRITAAQALEAAWLSGLPFEEEETNLLQESVDVERITSSERDSNEKYQEETQIEEDDNSDSNNKKTDSNNKKTEITFSDSKKRKMNTTPTNSKPINTSKKSKR